MSETEFNAICVGVFIAVVVGVATGFTYFYRWYKRDTTERPTREALLRRQAELEARFKRSHPDAEDTEPHVEAAEADA